MIRGLYTAASGMVMEQTRNDTIANNLANVNTAGYKKDEAVFKAFPEMLISRLADADKPAIKGVKSTEKPPEIGGLGTGVTLDGIFQIHSMGALRQTGAPLDVAIGGDGFFVVDTPAGERYTRNGGFSLDAQGYLVTLEGRQVLGQQGAIRVQGKDVSIDENGRVRSDGQLVDTLRIVNFADKKSLAKQGDSLFAGTGATAIAPGGVRILQGYQEQSNVNQVYEMVNMISAMRSYEASQKAVLAEDSLLDKAVNEVGRV